MGLTEADLQTPGVGLQSSRPAPQALQISEVAAVHLRASGGERFGRRIRARQAEYLMARSEQFLSDGRLKPVAPVRKTRMF